MKRVIKAAEEGYKGFKNKREYAKNTRRGEIEFDIPEPWSIQFYNKVGDLIDDIYVLAKNYDEAARMARYLCKVWDYCNFDDCVIEYSYKDRSWFNRFPIKLEGQVSYI